VFASPEAVLGRINAALRKSSVRLPQEGEELGLGNSLGAHRYAGEEDLRELLAKSDAAMYQAKREGRAWVLPNDIVRANCEEVTEVTTIAAVSGTTDDEQQQQQAEAFLAGRGG